MMHETEAPSKPCSPTGEPQKIQTVVLAPLLQIDVDFINRQVRVTQNGEPLAAATASADSDRLTLEVRPTCTTSTPVGRPDPDGVG